MEELDHIEIARERFCPAVVRVTLVKTAFGVLDELDKSAEAGEKAVVMAQKGSADAERGNPAARGAGADLAELRRCNLDAEMDKFLAHLEPG